MTPLGDCAGRRENTMNKITQRLLHLILQIWRTGGQQTSDLEATTVANALKAALRHQYPNADHLIQQSKMATHKTDTGIYHGCGFTWKQSTCKEVDTPSVS